jgi:NTP pyrophosphatase (non-canonical NTP hydrolase)
MITFSDQVIDQGKRAIAAWGEEAQLRMLQEEMGEAIAVVNQFLRKNRPETCDEAILEFADVALMLAQIQLLFGEDALNNAIAIKLQKQAEKLEESEFYRVRP